MVVWPKNNKFYCSYLVIVLELGFISKVVYNNHSKDELRKTVQSPLHRSLLLHRLQLLRLRLPVHGGPPPSSIHHPTHRFSHPLFSADLEHDQGHRRRPRKSSHLLGLLRRGE